MELSGALMEGVVNRLTWPDYRAFDAQLRSSGYCARPVRLRGSVEVCDGHGGRRQVWSTDGEPDELLRKACGNRREAICKPRAERYRGDAWQLIAAGLRGDRHQQPAFARVDTGAPGRRHRAPPYLRHAPHLRDLEPRRRHEHLHPRAAWAPACR